MLLLVIGYRVFTICFVLFLGVFFVFEGFFGARTAFLNFGIVILLLLYGVQNRILSMICDVLGFGLRVC
jgi:hypothetical protein